MTEDHRTEASCLLEQGAQYPTRIGLKPRSAGDPILAGLRRGGFSIYFGDAPFYHFDLDGRWQRAIIEDTHYLKGLDGAVHAIDRVREGAGLVLNRRRLGDERTAGLDAIVRETILELLANLERGDLIPLTPPAGRGSPLGTDRLRELLGQIGAWDAPAWLAHRNRFASTYGPPSFLPPEGSGAVLIDASRHDDKDPESFERHLRDVASLWGRRLFQAKTLYLGGPRFLKQPRCMVDQCLTATRRVFPVGPAVDDHSPCFHGIHAFLDDFASPRPDQDSWRRYHELGLARVSLSVDSGAGAIRARHGKTWADHDLVQAVAELKRAGLGASVLLRVGAGGLEQADAHRRQTAAVLDSLALARGDLVFLLDERELGDPRDPIPDEAWLESRRLLKDALAPLKTRGVKVVAYTMDKQGS